MSDEGEDLSLEHGEAKQSDTASEHNSQGSDDGERSSSDAEEPRSQDSAAGRSSELPSKPASDGDAVTAMNEEVQEHGDLSPGGGRLDYGPEDDNGSASDGPEVEAEPKNLKPESDDGEMNDSDDGQLTDDEPGQPPVQEKALAAAPEKSASDLEDGEVLDDEEDEGEVSETPVVKAPPAPVPLQPRPPPVPLRQASYGRNNDHREERGMFRERQQSPPRRNGRISPVGWPVPPPRMPPSALPSLLRPITPPEMIVPPPLPPRGSGRLSPRRSPPDIDIISDVVAPLGLPPPPVVRPPRPSAPEETAWDRGLRQARALVRQAVKRQETDVDFEEKRLNLTVGEGESSHPVKEEEMIPEGPPAPAPISRAPRSRSASVEERIPPGPRSMVSLPLPRDPYEDDLRLLDPIARAERYYYDDPPPHPLPMPRIAPRDDFYERRPGYDDRLDDYDSYGGGRRDFYSSGYPPRGGPPAPPPYEKERSNSRNQWGQPINGNNNGYGRSGGRYNNSNYNSMRRNTVYGNGGGPERSEPPVRGRNDSRPNERDNRRNNDRNDRYGNNERQLPYSRPSRPERQLPYDPPSRSKANEWTDPWRRSSSAGRRGRSRSSSESASPAHGAAAGAAPSAPPASGPRRKRKYSSSSYSSKSGSSRSRSRSASSSSGSSSSSSSHSSGWSSDNSSPTAKKNKKKPAGNQKAAGPPAKKKRANKVSAKSPPSLESTTLGGALKKLTQPVNPPVRRDPTPDKISVGRKSGKSSSPSRDRQPIKLKIINKSKVQTHRNDVEEEDDEVAEQPNSSSDEDTSSNHRSEHQPNTRARREYLLKQLQAVNDAISKKRARVS